MANTKRLIAAIIVDVVCLITGTYSTVPVIVLRSGYVTVNTVLEGRRYFHSVLVGRRNHMVTYS